MRPFDTASQATRFDSVGTGPVSLAVLLGGPGTLVSVQGHNAGADTWIQLFDQRVVMGDPLPADGSTPVAVIKAPAGEEFYMEVPIVGIPFHRGIWAVASSTAVTLTRDTEASVLFWGVVVGDSR